MKTVRAALYCAMIFTTSWISIPTPTGNANLGDGMILLCAWNLGGWWSVIAAAFGSVLTDLTNGFAAWAPGTALIKALTVLVAICVKKATEKRFPTVSLLCSAVFAELFMCAGYLFYESIFLLGKTAFLNIPLNLLQGFVATVIALLAMKYLPFRIAKKEDPPDLKH